MARGWESKSVEEQQSEAKQRPSGASPKTPEQLRVSGQIQTLELQRARVRQQLHQAENPRFIQLLQWELQELERQLSALQKSKEHS